MNQFHGKENKPDYYTIGQLSELSGVKTVTLRAWEQRYGLLKPERTQGGHRHYNREQLKQLKLICQWLDQGISIGQVSAMLKGVSVHPLSLDLEPALKAAMNMNGRHLEQLYDTVSREMPLNNLYNQWILPIRDALTGVGPSGVLPTAFFDRFVWQKVAAQSLKFSRRLKADPEMLIVCSSSGEHHPAPSVLSLMAMEAGVHAPLLFASSINRQWQPQESLSHVRCLVCVFTPAMRTTQIKAMLRLNPPESVSRIILDPAAMTEENPDIITPGTQVFTKPEQLLEDVLENVFGIKPNGVDDAVIQEESC